MKQWALRFQGPLSFSAMVEAHLTYGNYKHFRQDYRQVVLLLRYRSWGVPLLPPSHRLGADAGWKQDTTGPIS